MHWSPFAWLVLVAESAIGRQNQQSRTAWSLATNEGTKKVTDMHECFMDCEQDDSEWNLVQVRSLYRFQHVLQTVFMNNATCFSGQSKFLPEISLCVGVPVYFRFVVSTTTFSTCA